MCGWFMNIISININGNCPSQPPSTSYQGQTPTSFDLVTNSNTYCELTSPQTILQLEESKKIAAYCKWTPYFDIYFFLNEIKYSPKWHPDWDSVLEGQGRINNIRLVPVSYFLLWGHELFPLTSLTLKWSDWLGYKSVCALTAFLLCFFNLSIMGKQQWVGKVFPIKHIGSFFASL